MQNDEIKVLLLAMPNLEANKYAAERIRARGFKGTVAALVAFDDQAEELKKAGVTLIFSAHKEAGMGFADHVCTYMGQIQNVTVQSP